MGPYCHQVAKKFIAKSRFSTLNRKRRFKRQAQENDEILIIKLMRIIFTGNWKRFA